MSTLSITADTVRELLDYDPETGVFTWRKRDVPSWDARYAGTVAGNAHHSGYSYIKVHHRLYGAHRLAWLHMHGVWPQQDLDHINGDPADNRLENLRDVSHRANGQNQTRAHRNAAVPLIGVSRQRGRYSAQIREGARIRYLGLFDTPEEAHAAYLAAKAALHEGYVPPAAGRKQIAIDLTDPTQ